MTVYATNILGNGSESTPIYVVVGTKGVTSTDHNAFNIIISTSVVLGLMILVIVIAVFVIVPIMKHSKSTKPRDFSGDISREPNLGLLYSDIGPLTKSTASQGIHGQLFLDNDRIEYSQIKHDQQNIALNMQSGVKIDDHLNLDTLLIQIRSQVTSKWYEFGVAVGVSKETLSKCSDHPPEECIVEVLDNWLRTSKPTWKDVARGLKTIGLTTLADNILKVYDTGKLPIDTENIDANLNIITSPDLYQHDHDELPPPLPPKAVIGKEQSKN